MFETPAVGLFRLLDHAGG